MRRYAVPFITALASLAVDAADVVAPSPDARPVALVAGLADGPLRRELAACIDAPVRRTSFSLGHRGAPLHYPEHTRESYVAAAAMGAGVIECDVTFTRDKQFVCRHAQDDLHTTTDILLTPLAARCVQPFRPAQFDAQGGLLTPATAECRTSDVTLAEFRTLRGKRDGFDPRARTADEYVWGGKAAADVLGPSTGTLMSHADSIALFRQLGVQMVPELKQPVVAMPYDGMSQQQFAQRLIDDYKAAGVPPHAVWPQSFNLPDIVYWIAREPDFGRQAVYLEDAESAGQLPDAAEFKRLRAQGVRTWAPPLFALLELDERGHIVPSQSALDARAAGLELVTWSLERSGPLGVGQNGWYYQTIDSALRGDSDVLVVLDVLARQAGVRAVFSDWPATTTFYANCTGRD
jgi:glycerophosphoryl diester phosphodiesterase